MAGVPLTRSAALREALLDALPLHDWSVAKAGVAVGYSPRYAETTLATIIKKDTKFCKRINERRQALQATHADKIDKLTQSWEKIAHDPNVATRDRLKAGELLGKTHGIFSETRVIESANRQQSLTKAEQEEARRLAALRFDTAQGYDIPQADVTKSLPCGDIDAGRDIIDAQPVPNDMQTGPKAAPNAGDSRPSGGIDTPMPPDDGASARSPVLPAKILGTAKGTVEHDNIPAGAKRTSDIDNVGLDQSPSSVRE